MKRQKLFFIVGGVLMGSVCLVEGWFLFSAMSVRSEAAEARNSANDDLRRIYGSKVFPSDENITRVKEDEKALSAWVEAASLLVRKGDLNIETNSEAVFKQSLQATVRALSTQPGSLKGKMVESGFTFGFDKYLGDSASLPDREHVWRLTQQLEIINKICKELYAANILALEQVQRETFDEVKKEDSDEDTGSRRSKRKNNRPSPSSPAAAAAPAAGGGAGSEFYSKQRFTFVFQARPTAFVDALNRLAAMDLFVAVAETELRKTDDPLLKRSARKAEKEGAPGEAAAAKVDLATVPHVERIVTDPELEPPVSVKLEIDVYSFEGV
jgi:hypothetical protein